MFGPRFCGFVLGCGHADFDGLGAAGATLCARHERCVHLMQGNHRQELVASRYAEMPQVSYADSRVGGPMGRLGYHGGHC